MPSSDTPLDLYLAEIRRLPRLTAAEERRLGTLALRGDLAARRRLVEGNLRLVVAIARRFEGSGLDLPDLIQEGNLGLMAAAERFDPARGARFAALAGLWIRQAICRALSAHSRLVRVPLRLAASEEFRRTEQPPLSLAQPVGEDGSTLADVLGDGALGDPAAGLAADTGDAVARAFARLKDRRRRVLELRFGLDGGGERSLVQVAGELGISRERVRHLQQSTLHQLALNPELQLLRAA